MAKKKKPQQTSVSHSKTKIANDQLNISGEQASVNIDKRTINNLPQQKPLPKFLTGTPPQNAGFFGREEDLAQLENTLNSAGAVVVVNGLGGIGKTELCRQFFHRQKEQFTHLLWVDYLGSFRESLVRVMRSEVFMPTEGQTLDEQFALVMGLATNLPRKTLLVVDDIDDVNDPDLAALRSLPLKVVSSSRLQLEGFESYPLGFLDMESCKEIFYRFYKGRRDEQTLEEIIDLAGQHTLTVELLAKTANHAKISIADLVERLKEIGFNLNEALPKNVKTLWHDEIDEKKLFEHLRNVFAMEDLTDDEVEVLSNFCVLPSEPLEAQTLSDWLKKDLSDTLTALTAKGWLSEQEGFEVFLHPIIAAVARELLEPTPDTCRKLIESLTIKLTVEPEDNPLRRAGYVPFAQKLVDQLNEDSTLVAKLMFHLAWVYRDLGRLEDSLKVQHRGLEIEERLLENNDNSLASSYSNLALTFQSLGRLDEALAAQQKDIEISESVLEANHPLLATSYNNLSLIYRSLSRLDEALAAQEKAHKILKSALDSTHPHVAGSYNNLSLIYRSLGRLDEASATQEKAHKIAEIVLDTAHPHLAISYHNLAGIYAVQKNYQKALELEAKALQILEVNFPDGHPHVDSSSSALQSYQEKLDETK
ncbi:MAG: tetratricopeptide repeat protein [Calditrichia bacterium]